ncbi:MAG: radical SAM/SPASM domain-containing protein [Planctomycetota bacterium]|jgi:radical SAM protein with 4Fe4S-binding SPASM domain
MLRLAESQYLRMMGMKDLYRFFRTIWHWSKLTVRPEYFPEFIWLETTNSCNLRCKMCPQSLGMGRKHGIMSDSLFNSIIDQISGRCYGVFMFFGGDPLCDPRFAERVKIAGNKGLRVFVHTNAALLNEQRAEELIDSEPSTISFSLDTSDKKRYENWRIGAEYEATLQNISYYIENSRKMHKSTKSIIQLIDINGSGANDKKELQRVLGDNAPDIFQIRKLHDWAGDLGHEVGYQTDFKNPYYPCVLLWKALVICWDGSVAACCNDLEGKYLLGNAGDASLYDIWQGEKMVNLRKLLINGKNIPELCSNCVNLHNSMGNHFLVKAARSVLGGSSRIGRNFNE